MRQEPSDEIDTLAYAVSYLEAAKLLATQKMGDSHTLIVPFYALIGFSLENGLKALLEHGKFHRVVKDHIPNYVVDTTNPLV